MSKWRNLFNFKMKDVSLDEYGIYGSVVLIRLRNGLVIPRSFEASAAKAAERFYTKKLDVIYGR
ncbi:MAG: hypothetical protein FWF97_04225 [Alphaproteobacteria bacterium]|nr:hypothetical protein [Alphaproteobacteria bacterium]